MNQLQFPNIHDQQTVSSQMSMDNLFNLLKCMKVIMKHTLNSQNYMEKHNPQLKRP